MAIDLEQIKSFRLRQFDVDGKKSLGLLKRAARRYVELSSVSSRVEVFGYFINRLKFHAKRKLSHVSSKFSVWRDVAVAKSDAYSVCITGGVGDAIVVARFIRDIQKQCSSPIAFTVYYKSPVLAQLLFKNIVGYSEAFPEVEFESNVNKYLFSLKVNQFLTFASFDFNRFSDKADLKVIKDLRVRSEAMYKKLKKYVDAHPMLDGAFSDQAVADGFKRATYLSESVKIPYGGDMLSLDVDVALPGKFGLKNGAYITLHDGWDGTFKLVARRPTKTLPIQTWNAVVELVKEKRPDLTIVQIGGETGAEILGVDANLKNKLSFKDSASILAGSLLHVDAESGLVHLASALGVRSVVLFGPTSMDWFGYSQNINIKPKKCGNCWWSTDSWMDICPVGDVYPSCMYKHVAEEIAGRVLGAVSVSGVHE